MKKIVILLIIIPVVLLSCNTTKNSQDNNNYQSQLITPKFKVSPKTNFFIAEVNKIIEEQNTSIEDLNLSSKIIEKYNLKLVKETYYLFGSIKTEPEFDKNTLKNIGVDINSSTSNLYNISIPIPKLNLFSELDSIEYFQIAETVQLK